MLPLFVQLWMRRLREKSQKTLVAHENQIAGSHEVLVRTQMSSWIHVIQKVRKADDITMCNGHHCFLFPLYYLYGCFAFMCVHHVPAMPSKARRGFQFPGTGVRDVVSSHMGTGNHGACLLEQQPYLQPPITSFLLASGIRNCLCPSWYQLYCKRL